MEQLDNTGLGLIKATIERVLNNDSLFGSALKKLVNSSEDDLRQYLQVKRAEKLKWREEDNVIYFKVFSDGTAGHEWSKRLSGNAVQLFGYGTHFMSDEFLPTTNHMIEVAIIKASFFENDDRLEANAMLEAEKRGWLKSSVETACLIAKKFDTKEWDTMGLTHIFVPCKNVKKDYPDRSVMLACGQTGKRYLGLAFEVKRTLVMY